LGASVALWMRLAASVALCRCPGVRPSNEVANSTSGVHCVALDALAGALGDRHPPMHTATSPSQYTLPRTASS
jgi:hypothetical protein